MFLAVGVLLVVAVSAVLFFRSEIRSSCIGLTLSNGVDVLVPEESLAKIADEYDRLNGLDEDERWDQAILNVLRPDRPNEWKFLVGTLNPGVPRGLRRHQAKHAPRANPR